MTEQERARKLRLQHEHVESAKIHVNTALFYMQASGIDWLGENELDTPGDVLVKVLLEKIEDYRDHLANQIDQIDKATEAHMDRKQEIMSRKGGGEMMRNQILDLANEEHDALAEHAGRLRVIADGLPPIRGFVMVKQADKAHVWRKARITEISVSHSGISVFVRDAKTTICEWVRLRHLKDSRDDTCPDCDGTGAECQTCNGTGHWRRGNKHIRATVAEVISAANQKGGRS